MTKHTSNMTKLASNGSQTTKCRSTSGFVDSNKNRSSNTERNKKATLLVHEVHDFHQEPYITSGYRDVNNLTIRQCISTLFTIHNETFNIWSHILATTGFIVYFTSVFSGHEIIGNPRIYPLLCFAFGISLVFFTSACAHLFSCVSWKARHTCFYLDYASISIFTFTAGQAIFFNCRPESTSFIFHTYSSLFLGISVSLSCLNMFLSCLTRHCYKQYRFLFRTLLYLVKFSFDISPFMNRCLISSKKPCDPKLIYLFKRHIYCYLTSGITNACRVPERWCPGLFDLFGHSHHFLHTLTILGNYDAFTVVYTDMIERKDFLAASPAQPTFFNTFGLLIILTLANVSIVVWFVRNWLTADQQDLMGNSKYIVAYRKEGCCYGNDSLENDHLSKKIS